jgi:hypothetical protein
MKRLKQLERRVEQQVPEQDVQALIAAAEEEARQMLAAMKPINQEQRVEPRLQPRVPHYAGMPPPPPNSFPCEQRTTPNGRQLVIHVPGESMLPNPFTNHGRTDDEY